MGTKTTIVFTSKKNVKTHLAIAVILFYSPKDSSSCYTGRISILNYKPMFNVFPSVSDVSVERKTKKSDALCARKTNGSSREKVADEILLVWRQCSSIFQKLTADIKYVRINETGYETGR